MIKRLSEEDISRFEDICSRLAATSLSEGASIGTYKEKRTHRAIKSFITEDESSLEVKVGSSVADVYLDGIVYEIQTGSFFPLTKKIAAYLAAGESEIRVIYPIITKRRIVRIDKDSGEVLRSRMSSAKQTPAKILPELIYLSDYLKNPRLCFDIYMIAAEEHRYSDEIHRYRKSGKRDSELFPITLEGIISLETTEDFASLLPDALSESNEGFTAADFMRATGTRGRRAYLALGGLVAASVLKKEKKGKNATLFWINK